MKQTVWGTCISSLEDIAFLFEGGPKSGVAMAAHMVPVLNRDQELWPVKIDCLIVLFRSSWLLELGVELISCSYHRLSWWFRVRHSSLQHSPFHPLTTIPLTSPSPTLSDPSLRITLKMDHLWLSPRALKWTLTMFLQFFHPVSHLTFIKSNVWSLQCCH